MAVARLTERDLQAWIIEVAERFGWRCWHVPMPVRPIGQGKTVPEPRARGLCDLIMLHDDPPRLILAEVKGTGGKLSVEQQEFLRLARNVADASFGPAETTGDSWAPQGAISVFPNTIGVYAWQPGHEDTIEQILRSRVLI